MIVKKVSVAILLAVASFPLFAINAQDISQKKLRAHINYLCSDELEGRLTGTLGEKCATQYVANEFKRLGLAPAGDNGTYFQNFYFTAGVLLGKNNKLQMSSKLLILNQDWRPLVLSDSKSFTNDGLIFAGYGITSPIYDSYASLHVQDKWVLVIRHISAAMPDEKRKLLNPYASLRYKIINAKQHGAQGIIFVDPSNLNQANELVKFKSTKSFANLDILALSVKNYIIDEFLASHHLSLRQLQAKLDASDDHLPQLRLPIKFHGEVDIKENKQQGRNVLAKLILAPKNKKIIVIGAHVDHLGRGDLGGSRDNQDKQMIHRGADDNASGVASIIESAATLSAMKQRGKLHGHKDLIFAAWSGEELGVLGSTHFVEKIKSVNMDAMINLDMVGHLRQSLVLQGIGSSKNWPEIVKRSNQSHLSLIEQNDPYLPTDSTAFYLHDIPTLNLFTGAHDDYHTARDTPATLNYAGIQSVTAYLTNLILVIEQYQQAIVFHAVPHEHDEFQRATKIYLGTIPDYTANSGGVKLSGVAKDSPAVLAGLKRADVVIELAGNKIESIYDYTDAINKLHVGTPTKISVQRGGNKLELVVTARYR